ncbi:MAG: putative bifunctional diguanylate cyclase/phosphodiesterase [Acidimicrobiia bacterium]
MFLSAPVPDDVLNAVFGLIDDAVVVVDRAGLVKHVTPLAATLLETSDAAPLPVAELVELARARGLSVVMRRLPGDFGGTVYALRSDQEHRSEPDPGSTAVVRDVLTGLVTRAAFREALGNHLARRDPAGSVLLFDLDGFKRVNDQLGHPAGDETLGIVARRVEGILRSPGATFARLGGDEFAILVDAPSLEALAIGRRIVAVIGEPVRLDMGIAQLGASVGVVALERRHDVDTVLAEADIAMYAAKADGKGRAIVYRPEMSEEFLRRLELRRSICTVLDTGDISLRYRPLVDLDTGRITGFDALPGWHHPMLGDLGPAEFLPMAEETGHVVSIGRWMLSTALEQVAAWSAANPTVERPTLSVPVSAQQLLDRCFADDVAYLLEHTGVPAGSLVLSLPAFALTHHDTALVDGLVRLHELQVRIGIDGYAGGNVTLARLKGVPLDRVTVAVSLIGDGCDVDGRAVENDTALDVLRAVVALAESLGIEVVAGEVSDHRLLELARDGHCSTAVGQYLSAPLSPPEVDALYASGRLVA